MSYIAPDSTIHILHNVPLHKNYENTAYFENTTLQKNYFLSKVKKTYYDYTYLRKENVLRVEGLCDYFYDCNYLMFQNTAFGDKWFYAFIDDVRYINNNTTEIIFTIDVMQTWLRDYTFEDCYVEREHSTTDELFEHLEAELISPDIAYEYSNDKQIYPTEIKDKKYAYLITSIAYYDAPPFPEAPDFGVPNSVSGYIRPTGGMLGGFDWEKFDLFTGDVETYREESKRLINRIHEFEEANATDSIYGLFVGYSIGLDEPVYNILGGTFSSNTAVSYLGESINALTDNISGYVPKNKKLFNFPYNYVLLHDGTFNQSKPLKYEYIEEEDKSSMQFCCETCGAIGKMFLVSPIKYKEGSTPITINEAWFGTELRTTLSRKNGIYISPSTQAPYSSDFYTVWMASNTPQLVAGYARDVGNIGMGIAETIAGAKSGSLSNAFGGARMVLDGICNSTQRFGETVIAHSSGGRTEGVYGNESFDVSNDINKAYACNVQIPAYSAKIIDDYFTMYGYTCNKVKVPNRNARPFFTYTKTSGCQIHGSIPQDDVTAIESLYDNGIRFWNNPELIGHYSEVDNSPVTEVSNG